jgi:uracil-DNA glycosylase
LPKLQLLPSDIRATSLHKKIRSCQRCTLAETRTHAVYGRGDPRFPLWLIGEAPGRDEDKQGFAFVGRAGRLLDLCLNKKGITEYFISNVVKCRPPENRDPTDDEMRACIPWLVVQLANYNPRVIVAMGRYSIGYFLGFTYEETRKMTVGKQVGKVQPYLGAHNDLGIMPTYHPAYLLRNAEATKGFIRQIDRANKLCQRLLDKQSRS